MRRIANNPSSEVIITFEPQNFVRFAAAENVRHGDTVFGDPDWRRVADQPASIKTEWMVAKYRSVLHDVGFPFVLTFELVTTRGNSLFLIFGTTHVRGLQKMKEAMWEVDSIRGVQYRDPAADVSPHGVQSVFAHSYGGEVAARALRMGARIHELVLLSVPGTVHTGSAVKSGVPTVDIRLRFDPVSALARVRQRLPSLPNVTEVLLDKWRLDHSSTHDKEVWLAEDIASRGSL